MKTIDEKILFKAINDIRSLLDNVGQGLLSFGRDLLVHNDYSIECQRLLGKDIGNKAFPLLIYPENNEEAVFVEQVIQEVFNCNEAHRANVFLSLMPEEIKLQDKLIHLEYKLADNIHIPHEKWVLVILSDITEKRRLENKVREDEEIINMVANVAGNFSGFLDNIKEFQYFYGSKIHEILENNKLVLDIYSNVFSEIHTFKGAFSQFGMQSSVEQLHLMENALSDAGNSLEKLSRRELCELIYSFDIPDFLNKDMDILQEKLGSHFLGLGEMIYIDKAKLLKIESEIVNTCSPAECKILLPLVKKLKFKSLKEMLSNYTSYTISLAERLERPVHAFSIEGDDLLIDSERYSGFIKSLVHIFRNSVAHGLESVEERIELGKSELGNVNCRICAENNWLKISIEDDGRGIRFDEIRSKAAEHEYFSAEAAENLQDNQLIELIFKNNFSTEDIITELSGRGMGLFAVKSELEALGGKVELFTELNKGTRFEFSLPVIDPETKEIVNSEAFIQSVLSITLDFLKEHIGSNLSIHSITPFNASDFKLLSYSSFINIKGVFDGLFCISVDSQIAQDLLSCMVYESIKEHQQHRYAKDVISECANMILGNSIKTFTDIEEEIIISTPSIIYGPEEGMSYEGNEISGFRVETEKGLVVISIIQ